MTSQHAQLSFIFNEMDSAGLRRTADTLRVTPSSVLQAIWSAILSRYCGTEDCVFGTIVSGRPSQLAGVERTVGLFINAVPVRARPERGKLFSQLARELNDNAGAREPYQYVPLAEIQEAYGGPVFDHLLTFENYPLSADGGQEAGDGDGLRIEGGVFARTIAPITALA